MYEISWPRCPPAPVPGPPWCLCGGRGGSGAAAALAAAGQAS